MDEQFIERRVADIRALAAKADPFIRKRLLALASRYEHGLPADSHPLPVHRGQHLQQKTAR